MSFFERWFGGENKREEEILESKEKGEVSIEELTRCLNIFMANYHYKVGQEFTEIVLAEAKLTDEETGDMVLAANDRSLNKPGLPIAAEQAYLDRIRERLAEAIKRMDVAEVVEKA